MGAVLLGTIVPYLLLLAVLAVGSWYFCRRQRALFRRQVLQDRADDREALRQERIAQWTQTPS